MAKKANPVRVTSADRPYEIIAGPLADNHGDWYVCRDLHSNVLTLETAPLVESWAVVEDGNGFEV